MTNGFRLTRLALSAKKLSAIQLSRHARVRVTTVQKLLYIKSSDSKASEVPLKLGDDVSITYATSCGEALELMREHDFDGLYYCGGGSKADGLKQTTLEEVIQSTTILDLVPDGIALLDSQNRIIKTNVRLTSWFKNLKLVGLNFYEAIGQPTILGPEPSPLSTSRSKQQPSVATISVDERYFQLRVVPIIDSSGQTETLLVSLSDSTVEVLRTLKFEALHRAGIALADLRPEEIYQMDVDQRIELLKDNILHYVRDLLNFDVVEIRLIDQKTGLLEPLLSEGIDDETSRRPLYAQATGNGVTGFVTATGASYMCEDTNNDPLYIGGLVGAKSSLTAPLIYHDQVIGSFNVESPEIGAFNEEDLQFVEWFALDIAVALNTLELLNAQRNDAALQSVSAIHSAVALPIDEILNDTVHAMESYIGHDPDVTKRLGTIMKHARQIKSVIQQIGQELAPPDASSVQSVNCPSLKDRRVLVIDADEQVRTSAHQLLERYGCIVETAHEGKEAILMVRNGSLEKPYDAIIADIRLPDIGGYDLLMKLKETFDEPPLILMTGFGYDPGHSIVKARQAGLKNNALLFKPFRLDQLLEVVQAMVTGAAVAPPK